MSQDEYTCLSEKALSDIVLCEPITEKGRRELNRLGLSVDDINASIFFEKLYVESRYEGDFIPEQTDDGEMDENQLEQEKIRFESIQSKYKEFINRISSSLQDQSPLYILGVAGNGKSIEINKRIYDLTGMTCTMQDCIVYFDLELQQKVSITWDYDFINPNPNDIKWTFCMNLMDSIMKYLTSRDTDCPRIHQRFANEIRSNHIATSEIDNLFQKIGSITDKSQPVSDVFEKLISFIDKNNSKASMEMLLKIFLYIVFCASPEKKNYIIFDNIESCIYINDRNIQILDDDISIIASSIALVSLDVIKVMNARIGSEIGWKSFKIILLLRRTSLNAIFPRVLHSPHKQRKNIADLTGHFQITDIWNKKFSNIWIPYLQSRFEKIDPDSIKIIQFANFIFNDGYNAYGRSYQSLIAPLMSFGIRRNATSQSHAIISAYSILANNDTLDTLSFNQFEVMRNGRFSLNNEAQYMFRRALIESQFSWSFNHESGPDRWKELGLGYLVYKFYKRGDHGFFYKYLPSGKSIPYLQVSYTEGISVSLVRRVLSYLSRFPDYANNPSDKAVTEMFFTVSLFDLIEGVMIPPNQNNQLSKTKIASEKLIPLARVLIALSNMAYAETKEAPFTILSVKDDEFQQYPSPEILSELMARIYEAGRSASRPGKKYSSNYFGVRITDAGYCFLQEWLPSFSFMAAMYCNTIPPLFYLKNSDEIDFVISTVYHSADELCKIYTKEAREFCSNRTRFYQGNYFPIINNKPTSFVEHVIASHTKHLRHYLDYIKENYCNLGISEEHFLLIKSCVEKYLLQYGMLLEERRAAICF